MARIKQRRQRFTPKQYKPEVHQVIDGRNMSIALQVVTPAMEEAAVAVYGLFDASGPKVRERIRREMIEASMRREWDFQSGLVQSGGNTNDY